MSIILLHYTQNSLARLGLRSLLENKRNYTIVDCEVENAVVKELDGRSFSLLIINDIPVGVELQVLLASIRTGYDGLPVLLISDSTDSSGVLQSIDKGIHGFLTKECDGDEISHAIHSLIKGERFFCNNVLNILLNKDLLANEDCGPTNLTVREIEVTQEIALGLTSKEIGDKLNISMHTVQTHRKNIMRKLEVGSVSELILYSIRTGLVNTRDGN